VIVFDFHGSAHLSDHLELVDEMRAGRGWYFFKSGGNRRLAIDHVNPEGVAALQAWVLSVHEGQAVMELARAIKSAEEIKAMRRALAT
jgi:Xaa-Pro dipeptidase